MVDHTLREQWEAKSVPISHYGISSAHIMPKLLVSVLQRLVRPGYEQMGIRRIQKECVENLCTLDMGS